LCGRSVVRLLDAVHDLVSVYPQVGRLREKDSKKAQLGAVLRAYLFTDLFLLCDVCILLTTYLLFKPSKSSTKLELRAKYPISQLRITVLADLRMYLKLKQYDQKTQKLKKIHTFIIYNK
jgi:hypothetical protein